MTAPRAILLGGLVVGGLDLTDAFVFFGLRSGSTPIRICQSIASGLLGRGAYTGGWSAVAVGVAVHFFIAMSIVALLVALAQFRPELVERPWIVGPIYGLGAFLFMNLVVVKLAFPASTFPAGAVLANGIAIHMFGVGVPAALAARAARPRRISA